MLCLSAPLASLRPVSCNCSGSVLWALFLLGCGAACVSEQAPHGACGCWGPREAEGFSLFSVADGVPGPQPAPELCSAPLCGPCRCLWPLGGLLEAWVSPGPLGKAHCSVDAQPSAQPPRPLLSAGFPEAARPLPREGPPLSAPGCLSSCLLSPGRLRPSSWAPSPQGWCPGKAQHRAEPPQVSLPPRGGSWAAASATPRAPDGQLRLHAGFRIIPWEGEPRLQNCSS